MGGGNRSMNDGRSLVVLILPLRCIPRNGQWFNLEEAYIFFDEIDHTSLKVSVCDDAEVQSCQLVSRKRVNKPRQRESPVASGY